MKKCCNNMIMCHPVMSGALLVLAGIGMYGVITTVKKRKSYMKETMKKCTADCMQSCEDMCNSVCQCLCTKIEQITSSLSQKNGSCECAPCTSESTDSCECEKSGK